MIDTFVYTLASGLLLLLLAAMLPGVWHSHYLPPLACRCPPRRHTPGGGPHADTEPLVAADAQRLHPASSDDGSDREGGEATAPASGTPREADASGMSPPQRPASAQDGVVSPSRTDGSDDLELHTRGAGSDSPSDQPSSSDAAGGEQ